MIFFTDRDNEKLASIIIMIAKSRCINFMGWLISKESIYYLRKAITSSKNALDNFINPCLGYKDGKIISDFFRKLHINDLPAILYASYISKKSSFTRFPDLPLPTITPEQLKKLKQIPQKITLNTVDIGTFPEIYSKFMKIHPRSLITPEISRIFNEASTPLETLETVPTTIPSIGKFAITMTGSSCISQSLKQLFLVLVILLPLSAALMRSTLRFIRMIILV